jgi:hypothetical protein
MLELEAPSPGTTVPELDTLPAGVPLLEAGVSLPEAPMLELDSPAPKTSPPRLSPADDDSIGFIASLPGCATELSSEQATKLKTAETAKTGHFIDFMKQSSIVL